MATLAEIKTQLGIENLELNHIGDDIFIYQNEEHTIHISVYRTLLKEMETNPNVDLQLVKTKEDDNCTYFQITETSAEQDITANNVQLCKNKITHKFHLDKLSNSEIIIISVVLGTIIALIIGFVFCNYHENGTGIKVSKELAFDYTYPKGYYLNTSNFHSEFNYLLGIASFIISGGIAYLFLKRRNNKN